MSKVYCVTIDYVSFVTEDINTADALLSVEKVSKEYIDGKYHYVPIEVEASMIIINSSLVGPLTKEQEENKALAAAKSTAEWKERENVGLRKEVEDLKCQIKQLTKSEEKPDEL